ncbi:MAG: DUF4982 domain-containing protein, partial [Kiritimatiellae bacterium]|nr:DUF4982 domain-containing protein [Kiritimatiellia bacterium]
MKRQTLPLDFGWDFEPESWEGAAHKVDLPHDFQTEMPWSEEAGGGRGFKPMGTARYRNAFVTDAAWAGQRVFLDFEGIMCVGDVFINGEKVASSEYGYLGFEVDVTGRLHPAGGENTVEVWASTGHTEGSRWYTGGGLCRSVRIATRPLRAIARHGIFITTPQVSSEAATVRVRLELEGFRYSPDTPPQGRVEAVATIRGPDGAVAGETHGNVPLMDYRARTEFALPEIALPKPSLWDIDAPNLYTAEVRLVGEDDVTLDAASVRFGVRKVEFSPQFGFRLNGRKVFLKSMSNHADYGAVGAAQFPRAIKRELRRMKEFGFNAVRCSHNPYAGAFYDLADEIGLVVVDEFTDKWCRNAFCWMGRKPFLEVWPELMAEWIRRDRNHPSVILWSLGNELQSVEEFSGYDTGDWGVTTYRMMDLFVKRLDPTRLTTVGLFPSRAEAVYLKDPRFHERPVRPPELADVTDVASFNYVYEDYPDYFKWNPNLILFQSEASTSRWLDPFFRMDRDRTVGLSWWGAIEYWGESDRWPKKGWNYSFFSHTLESRPTAWLIRSGLIPGEPLTRIGVMVDSGEHLVWNDIHSGQYVLREHWNATGKPTRDVFVFSNAAEVELFLNGVSLGLKPTENNFAKWEGVTYAPGRLEARGANGSSHAIETTGPAARLEIVEEAPGDWHADGIDLKYLRIYAVDVEGRRVPDATNRLSVTVEGGATLLALDDGDHFTDELFSASEKPMCEGFALVILRAGRTGGPVNVTVCADGLPPNVWSGTVRHSFRRGAVQLPVQHQPN